jgi:hypothetical protein
MASAATRSYRSNNLTRSSRSDGRRSIGFSPSAEASRAGVACRPPYLLLKTSSVGVVDAPVSGVHLTCRWWG